MSRKTLSDEERKIAQERRKESKKRADKKYREKNIEIVRERSRQRYQNNPIVRETALNRRKKNKEKTKFYDIQKKYDLSKEEYCQMLEKQKHSCAICLTHVENIEKKTLCVDHCHKTGKVRGLLCGPCNRALGLFCDDKKTLLSSIKYLENKLVTNIVFLQPTEIEK